MATAGGDNEGRNRRDAARSIEPASFRDNEPDEEPSPSAELQNGDGAHTLDPSAQGTATADANSESGQTADKTADKTQGKLLSYSDYLNAIRSIIVNIILTLFLLTIIPFLMIQIFHQSVLLDQIDIPKTVQERRFTPLYVSRRLVDEAELVQYTSLEL
jgi:hypothetical protein